MDYMEKNEIYKVGDKVVFLTGDIDEVMTVEFTWKDAVWCGYCGEIPKNKEIRYATKDEIKLNKRG